jgi:hypothetical protein
LFCNADSLSLDRFAFCWREPSVNVIEVLLNGIIYPILKGFSSFVPLTAPEASLADGA